MDSWIDDRDLSIYLSIYLVGPVVDTLHVIFFYLPTHSHADTLVTKETSS